MVQYYVKLKGEGHGDTSKPLEKWEANLRYRLHASPIEAKTKGEIRRLRNTGYVPVSVQHRGDATLHLMSETKQVQEFIQRHGQSTLIELIIAPGKERHNVMVHDVQRDPLTQKVIQVTYQKIEHTDKIHTHVAINFAGEPEAVRFGTAMAQHALESVEIQCSQKYLPDHFTVDVSHLQFGEVIRVSDIPHDSHVTITTPADTVLMSLKGVTTSTAPETTEATEAVPEVAAE
jgi:large subunit ribosomal protein L25